MQYKILFTDIDGTLLNDAKTLSPSVLNAMKEYTQSGGKVVLSSGRPLPGILQVIRDLHLETSNMYIIAYNGAMVYDLSNQKSLWEKRVPLSSVRTILDMAHENHIHCQTYTDEFVISEYDTPELHKYISHIHMPYEIKENITEYLASCDNYMPFKLLAITMDDQEALANFAKILEPVVGDHIHTFFSAYSYLECCMKEASKGNAVRFLCDYLGISVADTVAAGDAANDISMLEAAGVSFAMANGTEDVKKVATYITKNTNDEDGILEIFDFLMR